MRWRRQHWPKSTCSLVRPTEQQQAYSQQNRRTDSLQKSNVFDAFEDDRKIDQPKCYEADRSAVSDVSPTGREGYDQGIDRFTPNPGLDTEPASGNECP